MTDFEKACWQAAQTFLQTVVVVDDRAHFGVESADTTATEGLVEPEELASVAAADEEPVAPPTSASNANDLDVGALTTGFAAQGLVCGVLKPDQSASLAEETLLAAERADILVLDWELSDQGERATDVVKRVLERDKVGGGRLRLIVVYTGSSPLRNISGKLKAAIPELKAAKEGPDLSVRAGPTKVVFLGKSASPNAPDEADLVATPDQLPSRLIAEFAQFAGGLLPNATLASIAALRRHTHTMLARFNKDLDGPLLTHRTLVSPVEDAEEYVAELIMDELEAQVPLARIGREYTGAASVKAYLADKMAAGLKPRFQLDADGKQLDDLTLEEASNLIEEGLDGLAAKLPGYAQKMGQKLEDFRSESEGALHKRLYLVADGTVAAGRENHEQFAIASSMRRELGSIDPSAPEAFPTLRLGAVLMGGGHYYICLTPLCDSVRIPKAGAPFLLAELRVDKRGVFNLVVFNGEKRVKLRSDRKHLKLRTLVFKPSDGGAVRAVLEKGHFVFRGYAPDSKAAKPKPTILNWLGELKPMQAQRFVQSFATHISRVGLDEFEWQRRLAPGA